MSAKVKTMKRIRGSHSNPTFKTFKATGIFPSDLTLGYEQECTTGDGCDNCNNPDDCDNCSCGSNWNDIATEEINKYDFLYAKEDMSVDYGGEINTHPFNFNWYRKNSISDYMDVLKNRGVVANESCGFHIHIGKKFFSDIHLARMVKFFYANPKFIANLSQRPDDCLLEEYACTDVANLLRDDDISYTDLKGKQRTRISFNRLSFCKAYIKDFHWSVDRFVSLNLTPDKTIEIRIFQGTVNKKMANAYLEFAVSVVLYTKQTKFRDVSVGAYKQYVGERLNLYPHLNASGLLKGRVVKQYHAI